MARKGSKQTTVVYNNLSTEDVGAIVMADAGRIKDKEVDPRKLIGAIHIKKYLADAKINGKVESWISVVKKLTCTLEEGQTRAELTSEEVELLEQCKTETQAYLAEEASDALKKKVQESSDEYKNLKDVSSSMKFKFSRSAYEVVTHVINLMVRELLVFTCDNCASQKAKLTKVAHIPWFEIQNKLLSSLYMNTKATYDSIHPATEVVAEEDAVEEVVEETTEETTEETVEDVKVVKPRLSQYISNTFKELIARDERFKGLLLGKEVTSIVNDIIYQVLDRYANVIKSLLQTAKSKTVNERIAVIATKILLQDHIHAVDTDVAVVLDVVQARLEELSTTAGDEDEELVEDVAEPVQEDAPKKVAKKTKA